MYNLENFHHGYVLTNALKHLVNGNREAAEYLILKLYNDIPVKEINLLDFISERFQEDVVLPLSYQESELEPFELLPDGVANAIGVFFQTLIGISEAEQGLRFDEGVPTEYFADLLTATSTHLVKSDYGNQPLLGYAKAMEALESLVIGLDNLTVLRLVHYLNVAELCYRVYYGIICSHYKESTDMEDNYADTQREFDTLFNQANIGISGVEDFFNNEGSFEREPLIITGNEGYVTGIMSLYGTDLSRYNGSEGFLENVKNGLKKAGESIMTVLRSIKEFFANRKKATEEQIKTVTEQLKGKLEELKKQDSSKYDIDKDMVAKAKKMLDDAGLEDVGTYFSSINSLGDLTSAYEKAINTLASKSSQMGDAEKALRETESLTSDLTNEQIQINDDSTPEEKRTVKARISEKTKAAKAKLQEARKVVAEALKPGIALTKLNGILDKLAKPKADADADTKKVTGNEAWMN